jgi:serine/threonine protein phosphatase 1
MLKRLRQFLSPPTPPPDLLRSFTLKSGQRIYAVGDIHGRSALLKKALVFIEQHAAADPRGENIQVFLGDYVDRGPDSRGVIDLLLQPPPAQHERICLLGNHEQALLQFIDTPRTLRSWGNYGGYATLASYGVPFPTRMNPDALREIHLRFVAAFPGTHEAFLRSLSPHYQRDDYVFVHAGLLPFVPLAKQRREDMLWIRDPFLNHQGFFDHYIVHGHTPVAAPDILEHRANIDVSEAPQDALCCLVIEENKRTPHMIS